MCACGCGVDKEMVYVGEGARVCADGEGIGTTEATSHIHGLELHSAKSNYLKSPQEPLTPSTQVDVTCERVDITDILMNMI